MNNNVIMMLDEMPTLPKVVQCTSESTRELLLLLAFIWHKNSESVLKKSMKGNECDSTTAATSEVGGEGGKRG